jgi:hypothetical protein
VRQDLFSTIIMEIINCTENLLVFLYAIQTVLVDCIFSIFLFQYDYNRVVLSLSVDLFEIKLL